MTKKHNSLPNRIASEDIKGLKSWSLPNINTKGKILPSAEKEAQDRIRNEALRANEVIEDVEDPRIPKGPLTAELLQEITESAEAEGFEQGRQEGIKAGTQQGIDEGREQALQEMRIQLVEQVERLTMIGNTLTHPLETQDNALEFLLLQTVKKIATSLVRRELQTDSSHILSLVKEAIAALPSDSDNVTLYLNPDDLALIEQYAEEKNKTWNFVGDSEILPGGCKVETKESLVDFSVESRLNVLLEEFETKQLANDDEEAVLAEASHQARQHRLREQAQQNESEFVAGQVSSSLSQDKKDPAVDELSDNNTEVEPIHNAAAEGFEQDFSGHDPSVQDALVQRTDSLVANPATTESLQPNVEATKEDEKSFSPAPVVEPDAELSAAPTVDQNSELLVDPIDESQPDNKILADSAVDADPNTNEGGVLKND